MNESTEIPYSHHRQKIDVGDDEQRKLVLRICQMPTAHLQAFAHVMINEISYRAGVEPPKTELSEKIKGVRFAWADVAYDLEIIHKKHGIAPSEPSPVSPPKLTRGQMVAKELEESSGLPFVTAELVAIAATLDAERKRIANALEKHHSYSSAQFVREGHDYAGEGK